MIDFRNLPTDFLKYIINNIDLDKFVIYLNLYENSSQNEVIFYNTDLDEEIKQKLQESYIKQKNSTLTENEKNKIFDEIEVEIEYFYSLYKVKINYEKPKILKLETIKKRFFLLIPLFLISLFGVATLKLDSGIIQTTLFLMLFSSSALTILLTHKKFKIDIFLFYFSLFLLFIVPYFILAFYLLFFIYYLTPFKALLSQFNYELHIYKNFYILAFLRLNRVYYKELPKYVKYYIKDIKNHYESNLFYKQDFEKILQEIGKYFGTIIYAVNYRDKNEDLIWFLENFVPFYQDKNSFELSKLNNPAKYLALSMELDENRYDDKISLLKVSLLISQKKSNSLKSITLDTFLVLNRILIEHYDEKKSEFLINFTDMMELLESTNLDKIESNSFINIINLIEKEIIKEKYQQNSELSFFIKAIFNKYPNFIKIENFSVEQMFRLKHFLELI